MGAAPAVTPAMLVRRITLDEYYADWVPPRLAEKDARVRAAMESRRRELSSLMRAGDELWEWKAGSHDFAKHVGLVVLREGQVVWSSMDWKS